MNIYKQRINTNQAKQSFAGETSVTQPKLSVPITELVQRFQKGIPLGVGQRVPVYGKAGSNFRRPDLVEVQEMSIENLKKIDDLKGQIRLEQKEKSDKKFKEELAKALKEQQTKEQTTENTDNQ